MRGLVEVGFKDYFEDKEKGGVKMLWLYIVLSVAAVATALFEFYVRFLPTWKENREKKRQARVEIQAQLGIFEAFVEFYDWGGIGSLEKAYKDTPISKRLVKELDELIKLALEYYRWRYECFEIINAEVRAQSKQFSTLNDVIRLVSSSDLEEVFGGTEGSASYGIYKAIYKGELTFDMAKESILKGNWDREVVIQGKNVMFRDIIDGGDFHKFIESLRKLQNRTSIKTLRNAQAALLQRVQSLLKEVF